MQNLFPGMTKKKSKIVRVFAPATVANACGFDVMGLCNQFTGEIFVEMKMNDSSSWELWKLTGDGGKLSRDASKNTSSVAVSAMLKYMNSGRDLILCWRKNMPLEVDWGSSAASSAAAVGCKWIVWKPFSGGAIGTFCNGRRACRLWFRACRQCSPVYWEVLSWIRSYDPLDIVSLPRTFPVACCSCSSSPEVLTRDARAVLPRKISCWRKQE